MANRASRFRYDHDLMEEDMTLRGWRKKDLSRHAKVSDMTVTRFMRGEQHTAPTAKKLAMALGQDVSRYLIRQTKRIKRTRRAAA